MTGSSEERGQTSDVRPQDEESEVSETDEVSVEEADAGVVLDVVEKGYRLNGGVLRPARVVVSG